MRRFSLDVASYAAALAFQQRFIVEAESNCRNLTQKCSDIVMQRSLNANGSGRLYRYQRPLFSSLVELECAMTEAALTPEERAVPLLASPGPAMPLLQNSNEIKNQLAPQSQQKAPKSTLSWESASLDPLVSRLARQRFGSDVPMPQHQLIRALLDADHKDILASASNGSGKTTALLLAALQGLRNENAGVTVVVSASADACEHFYASAVALCGKDGGQVVDREQQDMSWLLCCTHNYEKCHEQIMSSLHCAAGPFRLLIVTAEVLCELLFEKKLELHAFGFLRRAFFDDIEMQVQLLETPTKDELLHRYACPSAAEMALATLHQIPGPAVRSLMQIACVSSNFTTALKRHLLSLCIKLQNYDFLLTASPLSTRAQCWFSFHLFSQSTFDYAVEMIRFASAVIPGRAVLFVADDVNVADAVMRFRRLGMDAKMAENVACSEAWKFVVLHEQDADRTDLDFSLVSHVFILFPPSDRMSFMHMANVCTKANAACGWAYVLCDREHAKVVGEVVSELHIDFDQHVVTHKLEPVPPAIVRGWYKESLSPLNPQYVVQSNYERVDDPLHDARREFWSRDPKKDFIAQDYTPLSVLQTRYNNAVKLRRDLARSPSMAATLQKMGYLKRNLTPTKKLYQRLEGR